MKLMESYSSVPEKDVIVVWKAHITQSLFPTFFESDKLYVWGVQRYSSRKMWLFKPGFRKIIQIVRIVSVI